MLYQSFCITGFCSSFHSEKKNALFDRWVSAWLITLEVLHLSTCMNVTFLHKEPLYVALNRTLVLEAQFQLLPSETIKFVTWELENTWVTRVADDGKTTNTRTFLENNGALLKIVGVIERDYGTYKVTVTDINGYQKFASREVKKSTNPPKASLQLQCSVSSEGAQWDSPVFSWKVDGVDLPNQTGNTLFLEHLDQNYTCITESSQGKDEVVVKARDSEPTSCPSCTVWIVVAVAELIILFVLFGVYCYKRHASNKRDNL